MSDDIIKLGFEVDSSALDQAKRSASATATEVGKLGDKMDGLAKAGGNAGKGMDGVGAAGKRLKDAMSGVSGTVGQLASAFGIATGSPTGVALNAGIIAANKGLDGLVGMMGRFGPVAGGVTAGVGALATSYIGASAAIAQVQDKMAMYESRLKNALGSQAAAVDTMVALKKASNDSGLSFSATADTFIRMARNGEALGATRGELLQLTETIQKLGVVSGASTGEVGSGMLQLSQALASGRLNGDELRAVMENMPALAKAIADGLKVSVGQLRAMGASGELTGDKVFRAILSQTGKVREEFKTLPDTTERGFQRLQDSFTYMVDALGKKLESSALIRTLLGVTQKVIDAGGKLATTIPADARQAQLEKTIANYESTYSGSRASQMPSAYQQAKNELAALKEKRAKDAEDAAAGAKKEELNSITAGPNRSIAVAKDLLDQQENLKKLKEQLFDLESARMAFTSGEASRQEGAAKSLEAISNATVVARQKIKDLADAVAKLKDENDKMASAIAIGGGGGGIGIVQQSQQLVEQAARNGYTVSLGAAQSQVMRQKSLGVFGDAANKEHEVIGINQITKALGENRDAVIEAELAVDAMNYKWQTFGKMTDSGAVAAVEKYVAALKKVKQATEEQAAAQAVLNAKLAADDAVRLAGAKTPQERAEIEFKNSVARARRGIISGSGDSLEAQMKRERDAKRDDSFSQDLQRLQQQAEFSRQNLSLVGLVGREERVQTAILQKKQELAQMTVQYTQEQKDAIIAATQALADQEYVLERNKELQTTISGIWDKATDSLTDFVMTGKMNLKDFADYAVRELMRIQIKNNIIQPLAAATSGLGGLLRGAFSSSATVDENAHGGVYSSPDLHQYANTIVSSPTLFRFARGGAFGEMGEAGPEAIMPLKRGADGKLGVQAAGGGSVTVNQTINIDSRSDQAVILQAMKQAKDSAVSEIMRSRSRGGVFA